MKKTALVLSGGGFKGAFQYGALKYLHEKKVKYDLIAGISAGALNGAMIASDNFNLLSNFWELIKQNGSKEIFTPTLVDLQDGFKFNFKNLYAYFFKGKSIFSLITKEGRREIKNKWLVLDSLTSSKPLRDKLSKLELSDFKVPFFTGSTSLYDGKFYSKSNRDFTSSDQFRLFIESSATMPIISKPISKVFTKQEVLNDLIDGGVRNILPVSVVLDEIRNSKDEWEIIIINCSSTFLKTKKENTNLAKIGLRALNDIALNQIFKNNLKLTEIINEFVKSSGKKSLNGYKYYPLTVISPDGLDIGETLDSSKNIIEYRINQGYKQAKLKIK